MTAKELPNPVLMDDQEFADWTADRELSQERWNAIAAETLGLFHCDLPPQPQTAGSRWRHGGAPGTGRQRPLH